MKIIVAHNFYQEPGGEDQVFAAEVDLLRRFGHEVHTFELHNDEIDRMGKVAALAATIWNRKSYQSLGKLLQETGASVVHFHNTFPLISPAAYSAARDAGAAVVQTLHNFRLICPCALLFRDGKPCEECVGRTLAWPGIRHKCYRQNRHATTAVAAMSAIHRLLGTYVQSVDAYIAPSAFAKAKLVEGGLPAERIAVKPNFVDPDPGIGQGAGNYVTFVGRLSHEKGLETLLEAWQILGEQAPPLKIIGDGPLAELVQQATARQPIIEWLGRRSLNEVYDVLGNATFHVFPSRCYETFGRAAVEAFAKGTPVIASRHGAMADLVDHGRTGLLFDPGNAAALAQQLRVLWGNQNLQMSMRHQARREYELHYTGDRNHEQLMGIYAAAQHPVARPSRPCERRSPTGHAHLRETTVEV